jgi:signal transduction histidine kinase/ligand-binding sensor domain-containing protein
MKKLFFLLLILGSCNLAREPVKQEEPLPPVVIPLQPPFVTLLDTCPKPDMQPDPCRYGQRVPDFTDEKVHVDRMDFAINFTTKQGLSSDAVSATLVDHRGRLWVVTAGCGVDIFDGKTFETLRDLSDSPPMNNFGCLLEDHRGNIWIGSWQGVFCYNGNTIQAFYPGGSGQINPVRALIQDKEGKIWIGTDNGLYVNEDGIIRKTAIPEGGENLGIFSMCRDRRGNTWIGTDGGVYLLKEGIVSKIPISQQIDSQIISSVEQDSTGMIWAGSFKGKIYRKADGGEWQEYKDWPGELVSTIRTDFNGSVWIGSNKGLFVYRKGELINLSGISNLPKGISSISPEKDGNLWLGTDNQGVFCLRNQSFTNYLFNISNINLSVLSMCEDPYGNLLLGNETGLFWFLPGDTLLWKTRRTSGTGVPTALFKDRSGNTWIGGSGGNLIRWSKGEITFYTEDQGLVSGVIPTIAEDSKGNIWFSVLGRGLFKLTLDTLFRYGKSQGLPDESIRTIFIDKSDKVWLGTWTSGVLCLDGSRLIQWNVEQGLPSPIINNIREDSCGNMWFASHGGLTRFDGADILNFGIRNGIPDNMVVQLEEDLHGNLYIGASQGIARLSPWSSPLKNLEYAGTHPQFYSISEATGYPVKDIDLGQKTLFFDHQGILWIATGSLQTGLVRFDPGSFTTVRTPPPLELNNLKVNNQTVCWNLAKPGVPAKQERSDTVSAAAVEEGLRFGMMALTDQRREEIRTLLKKTRFTSVSPFNFIPQDLVLPYRLNNLTFEFSTVDLVSPQLARYRYFLEGYDHDWSPWSNQSSATFGNIREGKYTFRVEAALNQSNIQSAPLTYTFRVLPPWWRTSWAYITYLILAISGMILAFRWYNHRLIMRNIALTKTIEEKERVQKELIRARDKAEESDRLKSAFLANMSHEIRTPMNGILGFTGLLKEADLSGEDQQRYIGIIEKSGDRLLNIITNIVTYSELEAGAKDVKLSDTNLNEQLDFLLEFFKPQAEIKGIHLECASRLPEGNSLVRTDREKVYSILTNLLKNAVNFTEKGSIQFGCVDRGSLIEFYVSDTGIGISQGQKPIIFNRFRQGSEELTRTHEGAGLGLSIAKGYVELLGGTIWVEDNAGGGTIFRFTIKKS